MILVRYNGAIIAAEKVNTDDMGEYRTWCAMRSRCNNAKIKHYAYYGARGIRVCDRWNSFVNFYLDMGARPTSMHTLERNDVNGNYTPKNCRWATRAEQYENKTNTVYVTYRGKRVTLMSVARECGIPTANLYGRIKNGWTIEEAVAHPVNPTKCGVERKPKRS